MMAARSLPEQGATPGVQQNVQLIPLLQEVQRGVQEAELLQILPVGPEGAGEKD